jgi:hypothetical protein
MNVLDRLRSLGFTIVDSDNDTVSITLSKSQLTVQLTSFSQALSEVLKVSCTW